MFAVCLLVLLGIWIIPKIRESKGNAAWEKTSTEEKWKFYLDALHKMNWDTFQFGSYNLKDWHYDEVIGFLDRLESGVFPIDDWKITKVDGEIKHTGKITFDLDNVENYILDCHEMYIDPTLEKLFDKDCREDFRNGIVLIDRQRMTVAEAREYCYQKVTAKMEQIYKFKAEQ